MPHSAQSVHRAALGVAATVPAVARASRLQNAFREIFATCARYPFPAKSITLYGHNYFRRRLSDLVVTVVVHHQFHVIISAAPDLIPELASSSGEL